jgi:glutamyl-tRNA synthetase
LIAWLSARSQGGKVVFRIEDIDSPRIKPGAAEQLSLDLRWLGLDWDEGPIVQSERLPHYEAALKRLQEAEQVYPCTCSRLDVERAASAPHAEHEGPVYPGTCAGRRVADAATLGDRPYAWRLRAPATIGGDFVVWKSAGTPAYQLAVVVDDAAQGITEVVRGDDLLPSTPRQLLLYQLLNLRPPRFIHVPLVVGPDGRRLAKRHGDTRLAAVREVGVSPEVLVGYLAWSCGWIGRPEPLAAGDLLPLFRWERIPSGPHVLRAGFLRAIGYG